MNQQGGQWPKPEPRDLPPIVGILLIIMGAVVGLLLLAWLFWGSLGVTIILTVYLLATIGLIVFFLVWYIVEEVIRTFKRLF